MNPHQTSQTRWLWITIGVLSSCLLVYGLSVSLEQGSFTAKLFLDMSSDQQAFPYPFTIQNVMWVLFGIGMGDLGFRRSCVQMERRALDQNVLNNQREMILPSHVEVYRQRIQQTMQTVPGYIFEMIDQCLLYFKANRSVENTQQILNNMIDRE